MCISRGGGGGVGTYQNTEQDPKQFTNKHENYCWLLSETILSVVDQQVQYCVNDDTDALMTLVDPEITIVMDGYPLLSGFEGKAYFNSYEEAK